MVCGAFWRAPPATVVRPNIRTLNRRAFNPGTFNSNASNCRAFYCRVFNLNPVDRCALISADMYNAPHRGALSANQPSVSFRPQDSRAGTRVQGAGTKR